MNSGSRLASLQWLSVFLHKYQQPSAQVTRQGLVAFRLWSTRVMALVQSLFISFLHKIRRNRSSCRYTCCYLSSYASYTFPVTSTMLATYMLLRGCALAANSLLSPRPCCLLSLVVRSTNSLASFPVLVIWKCLASFPGRVLRERKNGLGTRLGFAKWKDLRLWLVKLAQSCICLATVETSITSNNTMIWLVTQASNRGTLNSTGYPLTCLRYHPLGSLLVWYHVNWPVKKEIGGL